MTLVGTPVGQRPRSCTIHAQDNRSWSRRSPCGGLWLDNERLQAKLRAQPEFLETTVDTSPSLLCSLDREGRIANLNLAATRAAATPTRKSAVAVVLGRVRRVGGA